MKLICTTTTDDIEIDLIDHPFVTEWANAVSSKPIEYCETVRMNSSIVDEQEFNHYIDQLYNDLHSVVITIKQTIPSVFFPLPAFSDDPEKTRKWCNEVHRWVVFSQRGLTHKYDNTTALRHLSIEGNNVFGSLFNRLNSGIHALEISFECTSNYNLRQEYMDVQFVRERPPAYIRHIDNGDFSGEIEDLLSNDHHTVWLAKRILGKDYRECYIDNDDPTQIDVVNYDPFHIQYSFEIDLNDQSSFYHGQDFHDWLGKYDMEYNVKTMGRIPLGNITSDPVRVQQQIDYNEQLILLHTSET